MIITRFAMLLLTTVAMAAQTTAAPKSVPPDPFQLLAFLQGTWDANVQNNAAIKLAGKYTFGLELDGHVLARHSTTDTKCTAPASFDCAHGDLLYVYQERPGTPLKAIYFDNEGHVIHYDVSTPSPTSVIFLSAPGPGPQFRLTYDLSAGTMTGKFQMKMPGGEDWHSYLEWSGKRS